MRIDKEDFDAWRTSPVGEAFFKAVSLWAEDAKKAWLSESWDAGRIDPVRHAALRERYVAFQQLAGVSGIDIEEKINEQQEA